MLLDNNHAIVLKEAFHLRKYTIYKHIDNLSKPNNRWIKELHLILWDDQEPVYDMLNIKNTVRELRLHQTR